MKKVLRVWTGENWRHEKSKVHVYPLGGDMLCSCAVGMTVRNVHPLLGRVKQGKPRADVHQKQEMFQIRICAE